VDDGNVVKTRVIPDVTGQYLSSRRVVATPPAAEYRSSTGYQAASIRKRSVSSLSLNVIKREHDSSSEGHATLLHLWKNYTPEVVC
jgi:hypothetical protein